MLGQGAVAPEENPQIGMKGLSDSCIGVAPEACDSQPLIVVLMFYLGPSIPHHDLVADVHNLSQGHTAVEGEDGRMGLQGV